MNICLWPGALDAEAHCPVCPVFPAAQRLRLANVSACQSTVGFFAYFPVTDIVIAVIIPEVYPGGSSLGYLGHCFCISIPCHPDEDNNTSVSIAELCSRQFPWIRRIRLAGSALGTRATLFPGSYIDYSYTHFGKLFVALRFCQIWGLSVRR